jgi:hypothetical protein
MSGMKSIHQLRCPTITLHAFSLIVNSIHITKILLEHLANSWSGWGLWPPCKWMWAIMLGVTHKSQLSQQKLVGSLKRICGYLGLNWEEWASTTILSWLQTVTMCLCLILALLSSRFFVRRYCLWPMLGPRVQKPLPCLRMFISWHQGMLASALT